MSKRRRDGSHIDHLDAAIPDGTLLDEKGDGGSAGRPLLSKRSTACIECRKHKMKCVMTDGTAACTRCARRGTVCEVAPGLPMLSRQYTYLQSDVRNIHETLQKLCQKLGVDEPLHLLSVNGVELPAEGTRDHAHEEEQLNSEIDDAPLNTSPSMIQAPMDTFLDASNGPPPSSHPNLQQRRSATVPDLVAQRLISLKTAEDLVIRYFSLLDQSLYGIASQYADINALRHASPVLFAAVCTVSALHDPSNQDTYEICDKEFRRLISISLFDRSGIEHLRALCIGSFWLVDSSRVLISEGVRRATDYRLHRHFYALVKVHGYEPIFESPMVKQIESRDKIRLWFTLFICDQHLSILHNRPGLLQHDAYILSKWAEYLSSDGADHHDTRIMSQVSLLIVMHRIRDTIGSDEAEQMPMSIVSNLNSLSKDIENWRKRYIDLYTSDPRIGDYPRAGVQMHYQFAKLYLYHHVYRGLQSDSIPESFLPAAEEAHLAAVSLFELLRSDESLLASMAGRPHYVFIMFAFAGHFLLEVCSKYSQHNLLAVEDISIIEGALNLLTDVQIIPQHPINRLKRGLRQKLEAHRSNLGKKQDHGQAQIGISVQDLMHGAVSGTGPVNFASTDAQPSLDDPLYSAPGQLESILDDFAYSDFGDFNFPYMNFNF